MARNLVALLWGRTVLFAVVLGLSMEVVMPPEASAQGSQPTVMSVNAIVPGRLASRLKHAPAPIYPMIARAARVRELVLLKFGTTPDGRPAWVEIVMGHPMLDQASLDSLAQWQLEPAGVNPAAERQLWVMFSFESGVPSKNDMAAIDAADSALLTCEALAASQVPADATQPCAQVREQTKALPRSLNTFFERRARVAEGVGLIAAGMHREALDVLRPASTKPPYQAWQWGNAAGIRFVAQAQAGLSQFEDAAKSCNTARQGFDDARKRVVNKTPEYVVRTADLKTVTLECADLLDRAGKPKDAETERKRAAELK